MSQTFVRCWESNEMEGWEGGREGGRGKRKRRKEAGERGRGLGSQFSQSLERYKYI